MSFSCADPQKSPPAPTTPCAPEPKHQRRSDGPCRTRLLCGRYLRPWPCIDGRGARPAKTVPATPGLFSGSSAPTNAAGAFPTLTDRKREILHLMPRGPPTLRSPGKCRRAQRPSATTSPTSLPSFKLLTGCRRSSVPGKQAWGRARRGRLQATGVRLRVLDGSEPVYLCTRAVSRSVQCKTCNLKPDTYNREAKCLECS
jgi:hypothetical protein